MIEKNKFSSFIEIEEGKAFFVADEYRTNPLSLSGGGVVVELEYQDGRIFAYDKIKYPNAYIKAIWKNSKPNNTYFDDEETKLGAVKKLFYSLRIDGELMWHAEKDNVLPWELNLSLNEELYCPPQYDLDVNSINESSFDWDYYDSRLDMNQQSAEFWG